MKISKSELKYVRSLSQKKVRNAEKKFLLEGWRALKDVLNSSFQVEMVCIAHRYLDDPDYAKIVKDIRERHIPLKELTELELRQASETVQAQGVIAVVRQQTLELSDRLLRSASLIVAADAVADPGNVGSILRTADWFSADLVMLGKGCVELYNEKVVRSTVGSLFHVPVVEGVDLMAELEQLKKQAFSIVGLSADGNVPFTDHAWGTKNVLVVGNEAHGVGKETRAVSDVVVKIPRFGNAESLNVGVACGIVLAHLRTRNQTPRS